MIVSPRLAGLGLGTAGIACLSTMDALVKGVAAHMPVPEVVFVRYLGAALWLMVYIAATRGSWPQGRNLVRHLQRGVLGAVTALLFFYAVTHLPLAIATAIAMSAPIYVSVLGIVFLKEPASPRLAFAVGLGLVGAAIIVLGGTDLANSAGQAPADGTSDLFGWIAAFLAPLSYASVLVLLKHHSEDESAAAMTLAQFTIGALVTLPVALNGFTLPPAGLWLHIAAIGLLGTIGFLLLIAGLKRIPASIFAPLDYTGLVWAALWGWLFFAEPIGPTLVLGGILIIAGCTLSLPRPQPAAATAPDLAPDLPAGTPPAEGALQSFETIKK